MTASTGKTGAGITFKVGDGASPEVFTAIANATNININGRTVDEVDFTHLASTGGYREFRAGFKDAGEVQMTLHFDPSNLTHQNLEDLLNSGDVFNFQIDFTPASWAYKMTGAGFVRGSDITINVDDPISADVTIRVTGPLEIVAA
ncbi:MAG: phage tail tube protein [Bacteroidota bacterium]|jgi:archaellin